MNRTALAFAVLLSGVGAELLVKDSTIPAMRPVALPQPLVNAGPLKRIRVATAAEFAAALAEVARSHVVIEVSGRIPIAEPVYVATSDYTVTLMAATPGAGFDCSVTHPGNVDAPDSTARNGIEFNCRRAYVVGLDFTGYAGFGSYLKFHCPAGYVLHGNTFRRCAVEFARPPEREGVNNLRSQVASGHSRSYGGQVTVTGNTFIDCATSNQRLSHSVYTDGAEVLVLGNHFIGCGNNFALGGNAVLCMYNVVEFARPTPDPVEPANTMPYLATLYAGQRFIFAWNRISGAHRSPFAGDGFNRSYHVVDYNDYRGIDRIDPQWFPVERAPWATLWGDGSAARPGAYYSFADWVALGFDVHSLPPVLTP